MYASTFSSDFFSRRLLLNIAPSHQQPTTAAPPSDSSHIYSSDGFDTNVVMVLSVLLCALICSLGLNSIARCALRCSSLVASNSSGSPSARLHNTGVKKKSLKTFPTVIYSTELKLPGLDTECVICLTEFVPGERVRLLPKCNHGFHVKCIDTWLRSHSSCPTCRHCLIETCQKIIGCGQSSLSAPAPVVQDTVISIVPLEPEGLIRNCMRR